MHGSTGLAGEPKPSYYLLQRECAPFRLHWQGDALAITCNDTLPSYTMKGYTLTLPGAAAPIALPTLRPGESCTIPVGSAASASVTRPSGGFAGTYTRA